ncbi:MAG: small multi-drug export protein [Candidatus Omnitrophota bacterium]
MQWLYTLPKELSIFLTGMLPVFELRGAIPLGFYLGVPPVKTFILAVFGNLIPVIPLYFLLQPIANRLTHIPAFKMFFDWLFKHTKKRADIIQRYEAIGLMLFIAIPLPITGAWTGTIAASLFKIKFKYTLLAAIFGVILAGVIVTILCLFGKIGWGMLG